MKSTVKQTIVYDEITGEILVDKKTKGSPNGQGWVIMYSAKIFELLPNCSGSVFKVFAYLAAGQQFEEKGMITTKKAVQDFLKMDKSTCLAAFKWLKDNKIIAETRINGCTEFMVNPDYITIGRDKKRRYTEWALRIGENKLSAPKSFSKPKLVQKKQTSALPPSGRSIEVE